MNIKKTYVAKLDNLGEIYNDVEKFCKDANVDKRSTFSLNLCLDEIFTNIVTYGYKGDESKTVEIELSRKDGELLVVVRDSAPPFNPLEEVPIPDINANIETRNIGGLGVFFIKKNMDKFSYKRENEINELSMAKKIAE